MKSLRLILSALVASSTLATVVAAAPATLSEKPRRVFVIPIENQIEPALLYVIRRGAQEAVAAKADAVVFTMDTPGGTVDAAQEICRTIQELPMPSYTLVKRNAFSAGAIIALSTDAIYMQPGSVIGDAMPIMISMFGGVEQMPDDIKEKMTSGVAAMIRANAQQNGHDPDLAEAMVRRDKGYAIGTNTISLPGRLLTLTDVEAARPRPDTQKPLLSSGTVKDLPEMLDRVGLAGAEVRTLHVTAAERVARWIAAITPLLLIAGVLGIYVEIKTPGFGLPGILGGLCIALFFWGHHIAGLAGLEDALLFVAGVALILIEVYLLPGHVVPGLLGISMIVLSLLLALARQSVAPDAGWLPSARDLAVPSLVISLVVIVTGIAAALLGRYLPKSRLAHPLVLAHAHQRSKGYVSAPAEADLLGQTGTALAVLRPAGTARIGTRRVDVVTRGGFIEAGAAIRVVAVEGARIVVEAIAKAGGGDRK